MGKDGRAVRGVTGSNGGRKLSALGSEAELALSNLLLGKLLPRESEVRSVLPSLILFQDFV